MTELDDVAGRLAEGFKALSDIVVALADDEDAGVRSSGIGELLRGCAHTTNGLVQLIGYLAEGNIDAERKVQAVVKGAPRKKKI